MLSECRSWKERSTPGVLFMLSEARKKGTQQEFSRLCTHIVCRTSGNGFTALVASASSMLTQIVLSVKLWILTCEACRRSTGAIQRTFRWCRSSWATRRSSAFRSRTFWSTSTGIHSSRFGSSEVATLTVATLRSSTMPRCDLVRNSKAVLRTYVWFKESGRMPAGFDPPTSVCVLANTSPHNWSVWSWPCTVYRVRTFHQYLI